MSQHEKGQYFTTDLSLKKKVYEYIKNSPARILEPSFGQGDLVEYTNAQFKKDNKCITFDIFEIDETITMLDGLEESKSINYEYCNFLTKHITTKYDTEIANPPYIKTKTGNLYIDFIDKCYELLKPNGELIVIVPSDFFKLTMAKTVLCKMFNNGTFTHIYHPNDEKLFKNASIDVIIFRYAKNKDLEKKIIYESLVDSKLKQESLYVTNSDGLITFTQKDQCTMQKIEDLFDVYVGIVSGKDSIYKNNELGNISVLCKKDTVSKFIYIKEYPSNIKSIDKYLLNNKPELLKRKIKKFNDDNWFEWGAPRNIKVMELYSGNGCIYINNITRQRIVAFKGKVQYFGGSLIMIKPKESTCSETIDKVLLYLNSDTFKKIYTYSGRFKIGHRQLSKSFIDI